MKQYIFVLGNAFSLARLELWECLKARKLKFKPIFEKDPIVILEFSGDIDTKNLINCLGGLVKIGELVGEMNDASPEKIAGYISHSKDESLTLGLSSYFNPKVQVNNLLKNLKNILKPSVKSFRYVLPRDNTVLSSIVVKKQKISEYLLIYKQLTDSYLLARILEVQDAEDWSHRDYQRPYASPKSGMLPPKVARMMVNIAGCYSQDQSEGRKILWDPFCGMGTILAEALITGWDVIGSDADKKVIFQAESNLRWLITSYPKIQKSFHLNTADATHPAALLKNQLVDAVVTEPFMGSPYEYINQKLTQKNKPVTKTMIANNIKGLEKLYIGALRKWHEVIKPGGRVVIILPEIEFEKKIFSVKKAVDTCEKLGYTLKNGPLIYARPQAIVKRNIYIFLKN